MWCLVHSTYLDVLMEEGGEEREAAVVGERGAHNNK
jgi:hypothetical protein